MEARAWHLAAVQLDADLLVAVFAEINKSCHPREGGDPRLYPRALPPFSAHVRVQRSCITRSMSSMITARAANNKNPPA